MRNITLSIAAIALMVTAANADITSKSFGGSASLFYGTTDAGSADLFDKSGSYGDAAVHLGGAAAVGSCATCTTLNYGITGVSTLGLESTLVSKTWLDHGPQLVNDGVWIDTLNLVFNPLNGISNTTMVVGRQALDTPMVFTEKWNIAQNTYDAAVAVNNDIENTTLVGAWVGRTNLTGAANAAGGTTVKTDGFSDDGFTHFLTAEGAYAFGAVTKAIPDVTAQGWYYIAPGLAKTAWLQADGGYAGFGLGAQYVYTDPNAGSTGSGWAVKLGYDYAGIGLSAAYSSNDSDLFTAANLGGAQSKLYTEAWWNYGYVSAADTDSYNVTATYSMKNVADFGLYYTNADHSGGNAGDLEEFAVTAGTKLGNLDATLAYINGKVNGGSSNNDVQAYLTYNF